MIGGKGFVHFRNYRLDGRIADTQIVTKLKEIQRRGMLQNQLLDNVKSTLFSGLRNSGIVMIIQQQIIGKLPVDLVTLAGGKNDLFIVEKINLADIILYGAGGDLQNIGKLHAFNRPVLLGKILN